MDDMTGAQLRDIGIARVARPNQLWLTEARAWLVARCRANGSVTIEEFRREAGMPLPEGVSSNLYGAMFRGSGLVKSGYRKNRVPSAHARDVGVWVLPENAVPELVLT